MPQPSSAVHSGTATLVLQGVSQPATTVLYLFIYRIKINVVWMRNMFIYRIVTNVVCALYISER